MTKQESAQRIYRWAFNATGDRKSGCIELLCAKELARIYEAHSDYDAAYAALKRQVEAWRKERRPGAEKVLKILDSLLRIAADELESQHAN